MDSQCWRCHFYVAPNAEISDQGQIITVHGEEEYMINHLNSFRYVELDGEFIETPFQHFVEVLQNVAMTKVVRAQGLHSGCHL